MGLSESVEISVSDCDETFLEGVETTPEGDEDHFGEYLVLTYSEALAKAKQYFIDGFNDLCLDVVGLLEKRDGGLLSCLDIERRAELKVLEEQCNSGNGLGRILSLYDGEEHEEIVDGKAMFIYRVG